MNCKPGDLAVLVRVNDLELQSNLGKLFNIMQLEANTGRWLMEAVQKVRTVRNGRYSELPAGSLCAADDCLLRPIRPQPDDAVDEMVLRVGKPSEVTA